ncbi:hypothetical protein U8335_16050 [Roseiconus lacunae]|uniref:hypothetical protein n=1 Tax=Roseiconus lacunae TaxID=2605694 RepID=UPI003084DDEF|nr:hypothetical protein U8335_16050 [Stieleria sp. HD01]
MSVIQKAIAVHLPEGYWMSEGEPNPYHVSSEATDKAVTPVLKSSLNFPGRFYSILGISFGGGVLMLLSILLLRGRGDSAIGAYLFIWAASCALIAAILPGSPLRRALRALLGCVLAIPFFALFVTVCAAVTITTVSLTNFNSVGFGLGTVVANMIVLSVFAVLIRAIARRTYGQSDGYLVDVESGTQEATSYAVSADRPGSNPFSQESNETK